MRAPRRDWPSTGKLEERTYHPNERKERRADGKRVYRIRSSAQWEVIPWVQTFGPFAELVAPAAWRSALKSNLDAMQAKYGAELMRSSVP